MIAYRLATAALLGALLVPAFALAEDGEPLRQHRMQEIHAESMATPSRGAFTRLDTNGDGRISAAEAANRPLPEPFWVLDRNHDGALTPHEYRYRPI